MLRGEIWFGVWPSDPKNKPRPLLIVSNNHRNQAPHIRDVTVVKLTSLETKSGFKKPINPFEDFIVLLKKSTIVRCGAIYSVEKSLLTKKLRSLNPQQMQEIDSRLKTVLDLN